MKRSFFLSVFLLFAFTSNICAQQSRNLATVPRPADYEYLSAPDSSGIRHPLKMPTSARINGQVLPYPVIFVHGLNSNSDTWNITTDFMDSQYGLTYGGRFDFCLNYDGNYTLANTKFYPTANADLAIFNGTWNVGDYYYVNFDVGTDGSFHPNGSGYDAESNQQAIVKQGFVLHEAIGRVLQLTGRDKVILMGHSMGGLASREYLQNPSNWQSDGLTHVAKLVTTGTPHYGSDEITGGAVDCQSEAVRDLRTTYSGSNTSGVYLFGGQESNSIMNLAFCSNFYNIDVDCNGIVGNNITGLNQKSLYTDLDYSCIIGECTGCGGSTNTGDGIVTDYSANLNNLYSGLNANLFHYYASALVEIHTDLPAQNQQNMEGLDEPDNTSLAYHIDFGIPYIGFVTLQANNNVNYPNDIDEYKFSVPANSSVTVAVSNIIVASDFTVNIVNSSLQAVATAVHSNGSLQGINLTQTLAAGDYYLEIVGIPSATSYLTPYFFTLTNSSVSGVAEQAAISKLNISPNPTNNLLFLQGEFSDKMIFEIYNAEGQIVLSQQANNSKSQELNIQQLSQGVYAVKIMNSGNNAVRFIKI